MTLYEKWQQLADMQQTQLAYWQEYFAAETENYKKILAQPEKVFAGKLSELAEQFEMSPEVFTGFMDGINESLVSGYEIAALEEDSEIELKVDFEKLFYNMLDAKAKWFFPKRSAGRSPKHGANPARSSTRTRLAATIHAPAAAAKNIRSAAARISNLAA